MRIPFDVGTTTTTKKASFKCNKFTFMRVKENANSKNQIPNSKKWKKQTHTIGNLVLAFVIEKTFESKERRKKSTVRRVKTKDDDEDTISVFKAYNRQLFCFNE